MTADKAYVTLVMLSMCELQDKGKGPYTKVSTLLSEYLVIQVLEGIKSNFQVYLLDFFCSGIQFNLLLSPYPCFISLLYLDLYVLGDDALIS